MEPITIEYRQEPCGWSVRQGDRTSGALAYEEMLGLVLCLVSPLQPPIVSLWMKTKEQHEVCERALAQIIRSSDE